MTPIERVDPPLADSEAATLRGFLNYQRDTLRMKTEGLDQAQLSMALAPSTMTLGGLLKHLALVEDSWFSVVLRGNADAAHWQEVDWVADEDWEWHSAAEDPPEELHALFDGAVADSEAILDTIVPDTGLGTLSVKTDRRTGEHFSLRWIVVHMIEEYARHNGHADLLRESIDGATGE